MNEKQQIIQLQAENTQLRVYIDSLLSAIADMTTFREGTDLYEEARNDIASINRQFKRFKEKYHAAI